MLDTRELIATPEDAARKYDFDWSAGDLDPQLGWGDTIVTMILVIVLGIVCFFGALDIAATWSAYDDVPARGVMDGAR